LQNQVERAALDKDHQVTDVRNGQRVTIGVALQSMPASVSASGSPSPTSVPRSDFAQFGLEVSDLTSEVAEQLGLADATGVVITAVDADGIAAAAGLQAGMVIARVGQMPVTSVAEFRDAVAAANLREGLLLLVQTAEGSRFVVVRQS
jgi:serine protease Do